MKSLIKCFLLGGIIALGSTNALAWDGVVTGKISQIHVTGGNNYGFRVVLEGNPKLCGNEHNWAYINESDSNYDTYVSVLLAANISKQSVRLHTNRKDGEANGYCHLGYILLLD